MKKLFFLGACLVALASQPVRAQTVAPQVIIMQVYYAGFGSLHLTISRGEGKTEERDIKSRGNDQIEAIQKVIAGLYQEGYTLKATYGPGTGSQSNFVFVKGQ